MRVGHDATNKTVGVSKKITAVLVVRMWLVGDADLWRLQLFSYNLELPVFRAKRTTVTTTVVVGSWYGGAGAGGPSLRLRASDRTCQTG